jgi:ABC-2 type transport system ATP-binding protein
MIEIEGLTRRFGEVTAVDGLTLTIGEGEVFGLLGPNGAGKTTTVRMLACLISRTAGQARIGGLSIGDPAAARKISSTSCSSKTTTRPRTCTPARRCRR